MACGGRCYYRCSGWVVHYVDVWGYIMINYREIPIKKLNKMFTADAGHLVEIKIIHTNTVAVREDVKLKTHGSWFTDYMGENNEKT